MKRISFLCVFLVVFLYSSCLFADAFSILNLERVAVFTSASALQEETINQAFMNINCDGIQNGIWLRPCISDERFNLGQGSQDSYIRNNLSLILIGLDFSVGKNEAISVYFGLNSSTQDLVLNSGNTSIDDISKQNGHFLIGLAWLKAKDKYYWGITANLIYNRITGGNSKLYEYYPYEEIEKDMDIWTIAGKFGYNFFIGKDWYIDPSLTLMLGKKNISNTEDVTPDNIIAIEPQLKIKRELAKGWQIYGMLKAIAGITNKNIIYVNEYGDVYDFNTSLRYGKVGIGINNNFLWQHFGISGEVTTKILTESTNFSASIGIKYFFLNKDSRKVIWKLRQDKKEQKLKEKEEKARLEAEEKARLAEENRIKKEETAKQKALEQERIKKGKEELERQRQLEIERKIQENYN